MWGCLFVGENRQIWRKSTEPRRHGCWPCFMLLGITATLRIKEKVTRWWPLWRPCFTKRMSTFCSPATYTPTNVRYKKHRGLNICFNPNFQSIYLLGSWKSRDKYYTMGHCFGHCRMMLSKGTPTRPGKYFCYHCVSRLFKARWHAYPSDYNQICSTSTYYVIDGFSLPAKCPHICPASASKERPSEP